MHHIGLPRSPFQQRRNSLASPTTTFGFSSPVLSQAFSPLTYTTPKVSRRPASESTGVPSASDALQDVVGVKDVEDEPRSAEETRSTGKAATTKQAVAERLYGLIDLLGDEHYVLEDFGTEVLDMRLQGLEDMIKAGLKMREETVLGLGIDEGYGKERMTLEELRKNEEESYLGDVSPGALQEVRLKVERQRRRKRFRQEDGDSGSDHGSRSSRWGQESDSPVSSADGGMHDVAESGKAAEMSPHEAIAVAAAAQDLSSRLMATLTELHNRKAESDEIHDLLVQRCESSTERILLLEYRIAEMEDDFSANASELKFLRLQLQAIEAQCAPYIERDREEDLELSESIMNWKIDWEEVNRRSLARRGRKDVVVPARMVRGASAEVPFRRTYSQHGT